MNFIEFIGFIITLVAMVAIVFKKTMEERARKNNPEIYQEEEDQRRQNLKQMLKSLNLDLEEEEDEEEEVERGLPPPPPMAKMAPPPVLQRAASLEQRKLRTAIEEREDKRRAHRVVSPEYMKKEHDPYAIYSRHELSQGRQSIKNLKSKKEMMRIYEIFSRPKSERVS